MDASSPEDKKPTRRDIFKGIVGGLGITATACISGEVKKVPANTKPEPNSTNKATLPTTTPIMRNESLVITGLPPEYNKALTYAKILYEEFPKEFIEAGTLKNDLLDMHNKKRIVVNALPAQPNTVTWAKVSPDVTVSTTDETLTDLYPVLTISPSLFNLLPPVEQVMALTHEISHYKNQEVLLFKLLPGIKGKKVIPEIEAFIRKEIIKNALQEESKELYKNCLQLFAIRSKTPNFKMSPYSPIDNPLPNSKNNSITLYTIFKEVKNLPNPENDPRWKSTIQSYLKISI